MKTDTGVFADLLKSSSGLQDYLQKAAVFISKSMKSDTCCVFLFDPNDKKLILRATLGFPKKVVGSLSFSLDEGLVGKTLREQESICEANMFLNPDFKLVPEVKEENFVSFLSVPIYKGTTPVGVLALHDRKEGAFQEAQKKELGEMASQMAATLENVQILLDLQEPKKTVTVDDPVSPRPEILRGRGASEGIAIGKAVQLGTLEDNLFMEFPATAHYHGSLWSFHGALKRSIDQLEDLQRETETQLTDVASMIFSTHILMLKDESFSGAMAEEIQKGAHASAAVVIVANRYIEIFHQSPSSRLKEKIQDVKDLGHRILRNLSRQEVKDGDYLGQIVIAQELLPSELIKISAQHAEGILLYGGGASAHVSILAKSLGIPVIFTEDKTIFSIKEGESLVLDGFQGNVYIDPKPETLTQFEQLKNTFKDAQEVSSEVKDETLTSDGQEIKLLANVNLLSDLQIAKHFKAQGIGLYRSEFPFIIRSDFPTEDEQYRVYRKILTEMKGKEVVLRTLDIGGDKVLSYMPQGNESNPFLGLRALRFSLKNTSIFYAQLRAMLRAGEGFELKIMFPLVSSLDDFEEAKNHVLTCISRLQQEGLPHNSQPLIGAMIELPSVCEVADELAKESDFLCVGTNDLVQYILGVDRTNEAVSNLYIAHHPAVLRTLQRVIRAALNNDCPISLCGEIAADEKMIPFLLGAGIRKLSVNPKLVPQVQKIIANLSYRECQVMAEKLVRMGSIREIHTFLGFSQGSSPQT